MWLPWLLACLLARAAAECQPTQLALAAGVTVEYTDSALSVNVSGSPLMYCRAPGVCVVGDYPLFPETAGIYVAGFRDNRTVAGWQLQRCMRWTPLHELCYASLAVQPGITATVVLARGIPYAFTSTGCAVLGAVDVWRTMACTAGTLIATDPLVIQPLDRVPCFQQPPPIGSLNVLEATLIKGQTTIGTFAAWQRTQQTLQGCTPIDEMQALFDGGHSVLPLSCHGSLATVRVYLDTTCSVENATRTYTLGEAVTLDGYGVYFLQCSQYTLP